MKKTEEKIIRFINENSLIETGDKVLLAFSGGPDSVFALHFFQKFRKKYSIDLSAVHFNHGLRGAESDNDQKFAKQFCDKLGVTFISKKINVKTFAKTNKFSIEEAARILRYKELEMLLLKNGYDKIVTAHNLSDNTETVILNLLSGTAGSGLSGIPIKRSNIIRPVLCVTKSEIVEYLSKNKIEFRKDSSNLNNDFKRNFLRNKILPLLRGKINPKLDEAVFRSTKNLSSTELLNPKVINYFLTNFFKFKNDSYEVDLKLYEAFGELPGEILKNFFRINFNHDFKHQDYVQINNLILNQPGKKLNLGKNLIVFRENKCLRISKETRKIRRVLKIYAGKEIKFGTKTIGIREVDEIVNVKKNKEYELISADNLDKEFVLRVWKPGDKFKPIGFGGNKKVSDFLTDLKISSLEKKNQLVLINRNQIVWIVGLRISDNVKITKTTKRVYKLWAN